MYLQWRRQDLEKGDASLLCKFLWLASVTINRIANLHRPICINCAVKMSQFHAQDVLSPFLDISQACEIA